MSISLFAYSDSDMDGVEDGVDKCPNTPLTDLVDINGCSKKSLISNHHFDIIFGTSYSDSDYQTLNKTDTLAGSFQADYYYKDISLQLSTSYFNTSGSSYSDTGFYDTFVGASYGVHITKDLLVRLGAGAILPTYDSNLNNNNTDYLASVNFSYNIDTINIFGGYSYTLINDDDYIDANSSVLYQDTNAYSAGIGYYLTNKLYGSVSYNLSNSIYKGIEDISSASMYGYYSIDNHWFSTVSYAYGLSDSASKNYLSLKVGYFF